MQRRFHYEQAFEHYLRANRVPYVAVDEAKKSLIPHDHAAAGLSSLKSFDFVVYGPHGNLLIDVKGRKHAGCRGRRLENWVTHEDMECLAYWSTLFGESFHPVFVFVYWCQLQPPDALFEEVFEFGARWYALREVTLDDYRREMTLRSPKWGTWSVSAERFAHIAHPFSVRGSASTTSDR